jgi:hypothetical protein
MSVATVIDPIREIEGWTTRFAIRIQPFNGNEMYGFGRIMRAFARLPRWWPIYCRIQHGFEPFLGDYPPEWLTAKLAFYVAPDKLCHFLMFNPEHASFLRSRGHENVVGVGAPVIYMDAELQRHHAIRARDGTRGTIAFPTKSTHYSPMKVDAETMADRLASLPKEFQPVRVCLYYLDVNQGSDAPYRRRGLEVVTNGPLFSQQFIHRFYENCRPCRYATTNDPLSSSILYAIWGGLRVFETPANIQVDMAGSSLHQDYAWDRQHAGKLAPRRFPMAELDDLRSQSEYASHELGASVKRSPQELRALLGGWLQTRLLRAMAKKGCTKLTACGVRR